LIPPQPSFDIEQINIMIESLRKEVYASFVTYNTYQGMETRVEIIQNRVADIQHDMQISNDKLGACVARSHKNSEDISNIQGKIEDFNDKIKELDERHSGEIEDLR
jgi:peptidoglycan hydrolase CwlO-like protein